MNVEIYYHSKRGSTKIIAEEIASTLFKRALDVVESTPINEPLDMLFLGCSKCMNNLPKEMKNFIENINVNKVKACAIFSTSSNSKNALPLLKLALENRGLSVIDETFSCLGKGLLFKKNHPDEEDKNNARNYAKRVISLYFSLDGEKDKEIIF